MTLDEFWKQEVKQRECEVGTGPIRDPRVRDQYVPIPGKTKVSGGPFRNKYQRDCKGITIDVYDVLKAFEVTCPAMQHAIKKMLCTGIRGHKGFHQDADEARAAITRAKELNK